MLDKLKSYLESIKITPTNWLVGVSGVLMVRFFLESLSSKTSTGFFASDASTLVHYCLFFLTAAVIFVFFIQRTLPSWKNTIPQLVVVFFPVIFVAPIIDWLVSKGGKISMTYLFDTPREIISSFFSFFGGNLYVGITLGMRVEIALILLGIALLVYFTERNFIKAFISALVLYLIIFVLVSLPGFVSMIAQGVPSAADPLTFFYKSITGSSTIANNLHSSLQYSSVIRTFEIAFNFIVGKILFLVLITLTSFWFCLNFKEKFEALIRNSRPERVIHYLLMIFLGIFAAHSIFPDIKLNWNDWLSVIVLCLSFYFSWIFAVCMNDIVDEDIDAVSNADRPLIMGSLSKEDMKQSAVLFLIASLLSGFLAGYTAFFFVLTFTAFYYIYSVPPTRFKLIPFFSSFLIGLCCLSAVLAGFFLISPLKYVSVFPTRFALAVVVIYFLGSHIRDMKDIKGDKAAGVKTVPIIFGDKWGPKVVGIFAGLAFLLVPIFTGLYLLFVSAIPAAVFIYYFVNKKPYTEKFIFGIYFMFVFTSLLLLFS